MSLVSYAPNQEDVLLWNAFGHETGGRFIAISRKELTTNNESDKKDSFVQAVSRSFLERGWGGAFLNVVTSTQGGEAKAFLTLDSGDAHKGDIHTQIDYQIRSSARVELEKTPNSPLLLIMDGGISTDMVLRMLDWEKFRPTVALIHMSRDTAGNLEALANSPTEDEYAWQDTLIAQGLLSAYETQGSYFFADETALDIFRKLKSNRSNQPFITQELLNLRISQQELSLKLESITEQLRNTESHAAILRAELTKVEVKFNEVINNFYLVQRKPRALAAQIKRVAIQKTKKLFNRLITPKDRTPKS